MNERQTIGASQADRPQHKERDLPSRTPVRAVLILNPEAGRRRRPQHISEALKELEASAIVTEIHETTQAGHAEEIARRAVASGTELVIVCGGDGTINEVVCGMAHSTVPLAILPGGTANVLARELGLPLNIRTAARRIASSIPKRVALGFTGTRYFLLMAGVGFDAGVVAKLDRQWKRWFGMAAYVFEALKQNLLASPALFTIVTETGSVAATFACISKSQFYGPIRMVREADLFSDRFYVYSFPSRNRWRYFVYALAMLTGQMAHLPDVSRFAASEIHCHEAEGASERVLLQMDGELAGELPCKITMVPDALTLLVPNKKAKRF